MALPSSNLEIIAFTHPDTQLGLLRSTSLPYERIVALYHSDGYFGQHVGEKNTTGRNEHILTLPEQIGHRLLETFQQAESDTPINCHWFGRMIAGLPPSTDEPFFSSEGLVVDGSLAMGELGIVAEPAGNTHHSLIGLGEDVPESIQVMSSNGEFGIARNEDVIGFYDTLFSGQLPVDPRHTILRLA